MSAPIVAGGNTDRAVLRRAYGDVFYGAIENISGGNEWSSKLFTWWLDELLRRMSA